MTLPADISRCQGIAADGATCERRGECERYLALLDPILPDQLITVCRLMCATPDGLIDGGYKFHIPAE